MDVVKQLFVIGAWVPLTTVPAAASAVRPVGGKVQPADSLRQSRPPQEQTPSCSIPTSGKPGRYMRGAGYGRAIPATSSATASSGNNAAQKAGIEQRSGSASKVNSSSSDDTTTAPPPGESHSKPVVARPGSSPQLATAPAAPPSELPTVAEVLRTAKLLLQPTHAVERQFYADCYRACQVIPSSRTPPAAATAGSGGGAASSGVATTSAQPPYLSYVPEVALRLSCLGHRIVVRRVTDSKHYWSKSMTNLFCYCVLPGTGIGYVLDPSFKEHFRAGRMSDRYRDVWECLPPLFVGPPAKLVQLVQSLCAELQASFESSGRQLPPWRTFSSTINRWMSPGFQDVPVPLRRPMPQQQQPELPPQAAGSGGAVGGVAGVAGGNGSGGRSGSTAGMIPAAEAQAFLRVCEELLAGTPSSARARAAGGAGAGAGTSAGPSWATTTPVGPSTVASAASSSVARGAQEVARLRQPQQQPQHQQPQPSQQQVGGEAARAGPGASGGLPSMRRVTGFEPRPLTERLGRLALRPPVTDSPARTAGAAAGAAALASDGGAAVARQAAVAASATASPTTAAAAPGGGVGPTWSATAGPRPAGWAAAGTPHGTRGAEQGALPAGQRAGATAALRPVTGGDGAGGLVTGDAVVGGDRGVGFTVRGAAAAAMAAAAAAAAGAAAGLTGAAGAAVTSADQLLEEGPAAGQAAPGEQTLPEVLQPPAATHAATVARTPAGLLSRHLLRSTPPQP